jgi:hypothetical protein
MGVLNCSIGYLTAELLGRVALGEGVLQYAVYEMSNLLVVNPWAIDPSRRAAIAKAFAALKGREIERVEEEMVQPDRQALDQTVFGFLGLSRGECEAVHEAVIDLVEARLAKARSLESGARRAGAEEQEEEGEV